jgi:hypothetical protein
MVTVQGYTTVSFAEGKPLTQPVSSFSSICVVVYVMKQADPEKSGISPLAHVQQQCVLHPKLDL